MVRPQHVHDFGGAPVDERADVEDLRVLFGDRDELAGCDVAELRMVPAAQRLRTDRSFSGETDDRLEPHLHLSELQRAAQRVPESHHALLWSDELGGVGDTAISAAPACLVHRQLCSLQGMFDGLVQFGQGGADRGSDADGAAECSHRLSSRVAHVGRDAVDVEQRLRVEGDAERVADEPGHPTTFRLAAIWRTTSSPAADPRVCRMIVN
jgi:hypothetical protein